MLRNIFRITVVRLQRCATTTSEIPTIHQAIIQYHTLFLLFKAGVSKVNPVRGSVFFKLAEVICR